MDIDRLDPDWNIPTEYPDLTGYKSIAVDLETSDPNLKSLGPGWARGDGFIVGIAVAAGDYKGYFPHSPPERTQPRSQDDHAVVCKADGYSADRQDHAQRHV